MRDKTLKATFTEQLAQVTELCSWGNCQWPGDCWAPDGHVARHRPKEGPAGESDGNGLHLLVQEYVQAAESTSGSPMNRLPSGWLVVLFALSSPWLGRHSLAQFDTINWSNIQVQDRILGAATLSSYPATLTAITMYNYDAGGDELAYPDDPSPDGTQSAQIWVNCQ